MKAFLALIQSSYSPLAFVAPKFAKFAHVDAGL